MPVAADVEEQRHDLKERVASHNPVVKPIGFVACGPSSSHTMMVKAQCQATTTSRLKARMTSTYRSCWSPPVAAAAILSVLAIANIVSNRLLPAWAYVPFNLAVAAAVYLLARRVVQPAEMGLTDWARGARWGGVLFAATLLVYTVAALLPGVSEAFEDRRVGGGTTTLLYHAMVRIPLGTVLLEELAFRGALPAVLVREWSTLRAYTVSSLLFGLWHVLPAWSIGDVNPVLDDIFGDGWVGQAAGVVTAVAATFLGGMWLSLIRLGANSLLAPILAHVATNSLGYIFAWSMS
jgi:CAAX protease family protein